MEQALEFVLLDDRDRQRILKLVKPTRDYFSYQNLNLAYGVRHREQGLLVTLTWAMSQAIMRDGRDVDEARYIVLTPLTAFFVDSEEKLYSREMKLSTDPLHLSRLDAVRQAIEFYCSPEARQAFEEALQQQNPETRLYRLTMDYREKLEQQLKQGQGGLNRRTLGTPRGKVCYWTGGAMAQEGGPPTLVFLHGLTADHTLFEKQTEHFAARYPVLVWDAPGHGASRPYSDFTYANVAADLLAILAEEHIEKPVLIGQSMGGYIIQALLAEHPDAARAFIAIDSCPFGTGYYTKSDLWWLGQIEWMSLCYPYGLLVRSVANQSAETDYGRKNMLTALQRYPKRELCRLMGLGYTGFLEANRDMTLQCPVLLLVGEHDHTGKVLQYNRAWHKATGYPLTSISNAAHNANADNPQAVNQAIEAFVEQL